MRKRLMEIWPEIEWIQDAALKERVYQTWEYALEQSVLSPEDLLEIPFTLLIEGCEVTFMEHKRAVVHIAVEAAKSMQQFFGDKLPIDLEALPVDLMSMTAHKIYGPKGIGALYIADRPGVQVEPILFGGGQQRRLRPGTQPTQQIVGFGATAEIALAPGGRAGLQFEAIPRDIELPPGFVPYVQVVAAPATGPAAVRRGAVGR